MLTLSEYQINSPLHEGVETIISRGQTPTDEPATILKVFKTDFGISTKLNTEKKPLFNNPNSVEGTLAYMSPEQTGRMNRTLDYHTDFYSIGIALYEMLTGKLPFPSNDPLEIVYSHIAVQPIGRHQIYSEIPAAISERVMNLLANASDYFEESNQGRTYAEIAV
jgi:serine/threonine protein kinase